MVYKYREKINPTLDAHRDSIIMEKMRHHPTMLQKIEQLEKNIENLKQEEDESKVWEEYQKAKNDLKKSTKSTLDEAKNAFAEKQSEWWKIEGKWVIEKQMLFDQSHYKVRAPKDIQSDIQKVKKELDRRKKGDRVPGTFWKGLKSQMNDPFTGPESVQEAVMMRDLDDDLMFIKFLFESCTKKIWAFVA